MDIGSEFWSFAELEAAISTFQEQNLVHLYRRDTRTIESAKKRSKTRDFNERIVYQSIKYACVYGGKPFVSHGKGFRPNTKTVRADCPYNIKVRATEDGQKLNVWEMSLTHNHEVTEAAYRSYNVPVKNKRKQEKPGADEFVESMQKMETFTFPIEGSNPEAPPKKMKVTVKKPRPGMDRWVGRVALVTGASSGIGHSVAKALVTLGMKVVGCARTVEPIQVLAREMQNQQGSLTAIRCDISKEAEVKNLFQTISKHKKLGTIHVIVNSAGLAHEAPLLSGDTSQWRSMLDVNILGTLTCTREAVNLMEDQGVDDGHIFLLNSMSGHRVLANKNIHFYGSTKYMITALTEGIRNELREKKTQTRVTAISPAVVETNFFGRMYNDTDRAQEFLSSAKFLEAKDVADAVIYALTAPPHVQVHDILMRATEQVS